MTTTAYLVDASIYIFRAYFSLPERWHSPEGYPLNAVYGYNAIARVRVTQTAPTGFAEGQVAFGPAPGRKKEASPDPALQDKAAGLAEPIEDDGLRQALARLGENILTKTQR